jgi:hypothetical protein
LKRPGRQDSLPGNPVVRCPCDQLEDPRSHKPVPQRDVSKAIAFGAIHRDTEHPHVHLFLHARQVDGKKIYLSRQEYASIDEKWAKIYSEFSGERSVYVQHLRKKEETKQWKIAAAEAYRKGETIPPKPERDNDRREKMAEQRLSAQRSQARDRGKQLDPRPAAEPVMRPGSERETSRLLAKEQVAREELAHLIRTQAPEARVKWAAKTAHEHGIALEKTLALRKQMGKEELPQIVYTTEEWKQLKEYARSCDIAVKDDRAAARLQSMRIMAGAELREAQTKSEAFETSRHFWKFDVEGWGKMSLREAEAKIKQHTEEKFKLYNFLRPTRGNQFSEPSTISRRSRRTYKRSSPPPVVILIRASARPGSNMSLLPSSSPTRKRRGLCRASLCPCLSSTERT